ncbi:MAG: DUF378 domain-containing protein [bacterium]
MRKHNAFELIVIILVIIGALNWGLVGFFNFDLVAAIFGDMSAVSRVIYALVGLAGLYKIYMLSTCCKGKDVAPKME